jgi:2-amino-4-hydroxy-6-hydroxymethyldihydropteridine diphosphokinase
MVARGLACLGSVRGICLRERSHLYLTPAWGHEEQPDFVNAVCRVETYLEPQDLLSRLKHIEVDLGRRRRFRWGPREIDLDILFYGKEIVKDRDMRIPHPLVCERPFVLVPLAEIAPDLVHPETGISISGHLEAINERGVLECRSLDI